MKIVVLGASGGCGAHLVKGGRARGHEVTAVTRPSSRFSPPEGVTWVQGDLTSVPFLTEAMRGADVVLSALGVRMPGIAPWHKPEVPDFLTRSTPAIVAAMKAAGVGRVVAISAGGVGDSVHDVPGVFKVFIKTTGLKHAYKELEVMERVYLQSGLDVCLCRPTGLTDEAATGQAHVVKRMVGRATIPRADVAAWMLLAAEQPAFPAKTPMITVSGGA